MNVVKFSMPVNQAHDRANPINQWFGPVKFSFVSWKFDHVLTSLCAVLTWFETGDFIGKLCLIY